MPEREGQTASPPVRATDAVRSDLTVSTELSHEAVAALTSHYERCVHEARRAGIGCLIGLAVAVVGWGWVRGSDLSLRLPVWVPVVALAVAVYEFNCMVTRLKAAHLDAESLVHSPFRAWTRPVTRERRRGEMERWLLLYATGKKALPAPFAAVTCVFDWPVPVPALLVDVAGVPKRGRVLTVFDAATGQMIGMGPVASTRTTVELMRQD